MHDIERRELLAIHFIESEFSKRGRLRYPRRDDHPDAPAATEFVNPFGGKRTAEAEILLAPINFKDLGIRNPPDIAFLAMFINKFEGIAEFNFAGNDRDPITVAHYARDQDQ